MVKCKSLMRKKFNYFLLSNLGNINNLVLHIMYVIYYLYSPLFLMFTYSLGNSDSVSSQARTLNKGLLSGESSQHCNNMLYLNKDKIIKL